MHTHICRGCHHTWKHLVPRDATSEQYKQAHMCPACGNGPWRLRYANAEEARASLDQPVLQEQEVELDTLILMLLLNRLLPANERYSR